MHRDGVVRTRQLHAAAAPRRAAAVGGVVVAGGACGGRVGDGAPSRRGARRREAPERVEVGVRVSGAGRLRDLDAAQSALRARRDELVGALRGAGADRVRRHRGGRGGGPVLAGRDDLHPGLRPAPLRGRHRGRGARAGAGPGARRAHTAPRRDVPPRPRRHARPRHVAGPPPPVPGPRSARVRPDRGGAPTRLPRHRSTPRQHRRRRHHHHQPPQPPTPTIATPSAIPTIAAIASIAAAGRRAHHRHHTPTPRTAHTATATQPAPPHHRPAGPPPRHRGHRHLPHPRIRHT